MPIGQDPPGDQRGIFQAAEPEHQVDAFGDVVNKAIRYEDLDADIRIRSLKRGNQRC